MKQIVALFTLFAVLLTFDVRAAPIDFLFEGTGTGTLDSNPFTDSNFSVMISADTDDLIFYHSGYSEYWPVDGTVDIDGVGVSIFENDLFMFRNAGSGSNLPSIGFGIGGDLIDVEGTGLGIEAWDMTTSFGPIFNAEPYFGFWWREMDTGTLEFTEIRDVTFTAKINFYEWILDLREDALLLDLSKGMQKSLVRKLDSAIKKLLDGKKKNDVAAYRSLISFINEVEAQAGKKIDVDDANALIDQAVDILEALESSL